MSGIVPAIGVDVGVWLGFHFCLHVEELGLIVEAEFFQDDGHLPWIRSLLVGPEGDWLRHGHARLTQGLNFYEPGGEKSGLLKGLKVRWLNCTMIEGVRGAQSLHLYNEVGGARSQRGKWGKEAKHALSPLPFCPTQPPNRIIH